MPLCSINHSPKNIKKILVEKALVLGTGISQVDGMDYDWTTQNLYFADFALGLIGVIHTGGDPPFKDVKILIRGLHNALELVVDPTKG